MFSLMNFSSITLHHPAGTSPLSSYLHMEDFPHFTVVISSSSSSQPISAIIHRYIYPIPIHPSIHPVSKSTTDTWIDNSVVLFCLSVCLYLTLLSMMIHIPNTCIPVYEIIINDRDILLATYNSFHDKIQFRKKKLITEEILNKLWAY